jgi:SAM-dependent methyltransferase
MTDAFDKDFWERHWRSGSMDAAPPNPYLARETGALTPGTALDAGCGTGAEAVWLAARGWEVTAADISAEALARAGGFAAASGVEVTWVEADLCEWAPEGQFDLVTTHYAHPAMSQLEFYERIAGWVAPGGTLLIVGHLHAGSGHGAGHGHGGDHGHGHDHGADHQPPAEASATAASITARLDGSVWDVLTAEETTRTVAGHAGRLHDVVVRATRRASSPSSSPFSSPSSSMESAR